MLGLVSDARRDTATGVVWAQGNAALPDGLVRLGDASSGIVLDVRYHGVNNFVGAPVDGYDAPTAILSQLAAAALRRVQASLRPRGFGLKVFDAYRPQTAVDHFVRWAADLSDDRTKAEYYPDVPKSELFTRGYIAAASGHSRGSTVDLTVVRLADGAELDMGTSNILNHCGSGSAWASSDSCNNANKRVLSTRLAPASRAHTAGHGPRNSADHADPAHRTS